MHGSLKAEALLQTMSAEEKVSQIFLVTFEGNQVDEDSKIFQLLKYQIVAVLRAHILRRRDDRLTARINAKFQEIVWKPLTVVNIEYGHTQGFTYVPY